jgi:hypothetical protein
VDITPTYYLILASMLFTIGAVGLLVRRNFSRPADGAGRRRAAARGGQLKEQEQTSPVSDGTHRGPLGYGSGSLSAHKPDDMLLE